MKRMLLALVAAASLAACAHAQTDALPKITPPAVAEAPKVCAPGNTLDEKVLIGAELFYASAADGYLVVQRAQPFAEPTKGQIKAGLATGYDALKLARAAYRVCDAPTMFGKIGQAYGLISGAKALLPKGR